MRTDAQLMCKDNENEHGKLDGLSEEGHLAVFIIVGPAAFLRY